MLNMFVHNYKSVCVCVRSYAMNVEGYFSFESRSWNMEGMRGGGNSDLLTGVRGERGGINNFLWEKEGNLHCTLHKDWYANLIIPIIFLYFYDFKFIHYHCIPIFLYPNIPESQYPCIPISLYPNITVFQYPSIKISLYPNIPVSQYP